MSTPFARDVSVWRVPPQTYICETTPSRRRHRSAPLSLSLSLSVLCNGFYSDPRSYVLGVRAPKAVYARAEGGKGGGATSARGARRTVCRHEVCQLVGHGKGVVLGQALLLLLLLLLRVYRVAQFVTHKGKRRARPLLGDVLKGRCRLRKGSLAASHRGRRRGREAEQRMVGRGSRRQRQRQR